MDLEDEIELGQILEAGDLSSLKLYCNSNKIDVLWTSCLEYAWLHSFECAIGGEFQSRRILYHLFRYLQQELLHCDGLNRLKKDNCLSIIHSGQGFCFNRCVRAIGLAEIVITKFGYNVFKHIPLSHDLCKVIINFYM